MSSLRQSYGNIARSPTRPYANNLTLNNDGVTIDMAQDFSLTNGPVRFFVVPNADTDLQIGALFLAVSDNGTPDIGGWGNIGTPLTVGVRFFIEDVEGVVYDQSILKTNQDLIRTATETSQLAFSGTIRVLRYRRQYVPFSSCFNLHARHPEDKFGVELHDNFSTLTEMSMYVDGASLLAQVP